MVQYQNEEKTMIEKKELIEKVNSMAEFNNWCGIKVLSATEGAVEIQIEWRKEMGHFGVFRRQHGERVWPLWLQRLEDAVPALRQSRSAPLPDEQSLRPSARSRSGKSADAAGTEEL